MIKKTVCLCLVSGFLALRRLDSNSQRASLLVSVHTVPMGQMTQRVPRALFTLPALPHTQFIMRGGLIGSSCSTLTVPEGESWQPLLSAQPYVPSHPAPSSCHGSMPSRSSLAEGAACPGTGDCCQSHSHAKHVMNTCHVLPYPSGCASYRALSER